MRINFDLEDLKAFLAVNETGSFHRAAEQLAISQSAVTRRVKKLETALDTQLFVRTTRSVKPTLAAKRLHPRAEAMLHDALETTRAIRDETAAYAHQRSLIVTVATIPTIIPEIVPQVIAAYRAGGHNSRIRFLDHAANEVAEAVTGGDADFAICSMPAHEPGLNFHHLFEDRLVLAIPSDHPFARLETVDWAHLATENLILPARHTGNRTLIDDTTARKGITLRWTFETQRSTTAYALVAGGGCVAILPLSQVRSARDDRVLWRPFSGPGIARPVGLLSRSGQSERREVAALMAATKTVCSQEFSTG